MMTDTMVRQGTMNILDPTGHTLVQWDPSDEEQVAEARRAFNDALSRGYSAFMIVRDGVTKKKGDRVTSFNPLVTEYMLIPQLVGG